MAHFLFLLLAILCIVAIAGFIISKNQAYSALFVILAFVCTAGLFAMADAPFVAVVQIIIYAGAIMVLFIFAIMMIDLKKGLAPEKKRWITAASVGLGIILLLELLFAVTKLPGVTSSETLGEPSQLGEILFTKYLYPFEITSVLIIAALVGAMVLMKKQENE